MPITLQNIADHLGLSVATVSRALADVPTVAAKTRARVLAAAAAMGYYPNVMARRLQKQRTDTIGFVIPTFGLRFSDPFFSELLAGVGNAAAKHEMDLLVSTCAPGPEELAVYERIVKQCRVDGMLVVRTRVQDQRIAYLVEHNFPFVAFGRTEQALDFPYIDVDGYAGLRALTQHLIDLGHHVIAYVSAPLELMFAKYRLQGYQDVLKANHLLYDAALIQIGALTEQDGYEAGKQLLCGDKAPTAIIASNDLMALGVINAARACGLQVGRDVAVAGFDDIPVSSHAQPPLTTIHQPIYEIGRRSCEMLITLLSGQRLATPQVLLQPELVVRQSTQVIVKGGA